MADELLDDLKQRLGLDIIKVEVGSVDFLTDMTMLKVYYKDTERGVKSVDRVVKIPQENEL